MSDIWNRKYEQVILQTAALTVNYAPIIAVFFPVTAHANDVVDHGTWNPPGVRPKVGALLHLRGDNDDSLRLRDPTLHWQGERS